MSARDSVCGVIDGGGQDGGGQIDQHHCMSSRDSVCRVIDGRGLTKPFRVKLAHNSDAGYHSFVSAGY